LIGIGDALLRLTGRTPLALAQASFENIIVVLGD
jgi:hypothetical protein